MPLMGGAILFLWGLFLFFLFNSSRDLLFFLSFLLVESSNQSVINRKQCAPNDIHNKRVPSEAKYGNQKRKNHNHFCKLVQFGKHN